MLKIIMVYLTIERTDESNSNRPFVITSQMCSFASPPTTLEYVAVSPDEKSDE